MESRKDTGRWDMALWVQAGLCAAVIFSFIPLARGLQKYVYSAFGKETFTYAVILIIAVLMVLYLYRLRLRMKSVSQYVWLCLSGTVYIYSAVCLRGHPEEAVHLLEYGLLAFFVFRAVSYRIQDWTAYPSSWFIVLFAGSTDEFIQWMVPGRVGDLRDIGINIFAGTVFLVTLNKCYKPDIKSGKATPYAVRFLSETAAAALLMIGLCLYIFN